MSKINRLLDTFFGVNDDDHALIESLKRARPPRPLTNGKITTSDGIEILWLKREITGRGAMSSNLLEFLNQPRAMEFKNILGRLSDDALENISIDRDESAIILRQGTHIQRLENIDFECEKFLFDTVLNMHIAHRKAAKIVNAYNL
tara:strand:+ start:15370 stop:15807 length:438 start_codon:yes stop_codon:yes gene_type:complete